MSSNKSLRSDKGRINLSEIGCTHIDDKDMCETLRSDRGRINLGRIFQPIPDKNNAPEPSNFHEHESSNACGDNTRDELGTDSYIADTLGKHEANDRGVNLPKRNKSADPHTQSNGKTQSEKSEGDDYITKALLKYLQDVPSEMIDEDITPTLPGSPGSSTKNKKADNNPVTAEESNDTNEYSLAQYFKAHIPMAVIDGRLHLFKSPCYRYYPQKALITELKAILPEVTRRDCKIAQLKRAVEQLETEADLVIDLADISYNPAEIVFSNGIYNVRSNAMRNGEPDDYYISSNSVSFHSKLGKPGKSGYVAKQFFEQASNGDPQIEDLLWLTIGVMLSTETTFKTFFFLYGPPNTGKSIFGNLVQRLIGLDNCSNIQLHEVDAKYHSAELIGKRANISLDQPDITIMNIGVFKQLTSGGTDSVATEKKYGSINRLDSRFIKFLFAGNKLPRLKAYDEAFWSRMVLIPFKHQVASHERNLNLSEDLWKEKDFIIRKALKSYERFLDRGMEFPYCARAEELKRLDLPVSPLDIVNSFINESCQLNIDMFTPTKKLYVAYTNFCNAKGYRSESETMFSQRISKLPSLEKGREGSIRGFYGIQLNEPINQSFY